MRLLIRILANSAAILAAAYLIPGFRFTGSPTDLLIAGVILGLINALVKPIVQIIALPAIFLTLGLFNIVINVAMLFLATKFIPGLYIDSIWAAFLGVIVISVINHIISRFSRSGDVNNF